MENISGTEPVCIIGSGLSAIDTLHTLLAAGQKEKVYFVSRNGLLPKVQGVPERYDLQFLSMDQIKRFLSKKGQAQIRLDQLINAKKIRDLLRCGQLDILSGINSICHTPSRNIFSIDLRTRGDDCQTLEVPIIINATGQCLNVCQFNSKLMENMLSPGIAISHPRGGIAVDYETGRVLHKNGRVSNSLFALGELTRGVHFYTNGIDHCVHRAKDIVRFIVDQ